MNWLVVRLFGVLVLGIGATGCRCGHGPSPGPDEAEIGSAPLSARDIEGEDPPEAPGRCLPVNGARSIIFRERDEEIEVGADVSWAEGFAVALSRQAPSGRPSIFMVRNGKTEEVKLPEAHGGAPPPELAVAAGALFALGEGADAGGPTLDLYRLSMEPGSVPAKPRSLAIEHRLFESGTLAATAEHVLVAWDVRDRASDMTSIRVEVLRSSDLHPVRPSFGLAGHGLDAASPEVLGHEGGFYVLWLEYAKPLSGSHDAGGGLVEARPVRLWITSLDASGTVHGAPIALTPELPDLEYDAVLWNGDPWVLVRHLPEGAMELLRVDSAGHIEAHPVTSVALGQLPPMLLPMGTRLGVHVQASHGEALLGFYPGSGPLVTLTVEEKLGPRDILGTDGTRIVALAAAEGEVALELIECEASLAAAE